MADEAVDKLGGKTPLQVANTPAMDKLAKLGRCGLFSTVPKSFTPGSEIANLTVLGYDVTKDFEGRGSLEAASMGINILDEEMAMRCNLICIEDKKIKLEVTQEAIIDGETIEECKEFVTTTDMPSIIRNKLGYNLEDLRPGQNLKYVRSRDKEYDGIVSDAEVERRDREREITVLREEIASRIKDDEVKYAWRGLAREGAGVLIDGARAYGEIALKTAGAASVGFMASGMATSGKDQDIATKFFAGYAAADSLYNTADAAINGITDDLDQPSDNYNPIQTIENIRNRRKQKAKRKNNEETDEKTDEDSPISSDEE